MWKQVSCLIVIALVSSVLMSGCSSSDDKAMSKEDVAALLGVDANNNGVRDDVEKKIYEKYEKPLHQALLMERAKFYQLTLEKPLDKAKETQKLASKNISCKLYLKDIDKDIGSDGWRENREYIKNLVLNNPQRVRKYLDYNRALSGGSYGSSPSDWNRDACSQEVVKALEDMGL